MTIEEAVADYAKAVAEWDTAKDTTKRLHKEYLAAELACNRADEKHEAARKALLAVASGRDTDVAVRLSAEPAVDVMTRGGAG